MLIMERSEPVLVPEWYKTANGSATSGTNLNHPARSSAQLDEHGVGTSSRNRLLLSAGDRDALRSSTFADRSSSSPRGTSSDNGSMVRDKDSSATSHPYSSFGRNRRDRGREKDRDLRTRDRSLVANGYHDHSDPFKAGSKDRLRRCDSLGSGRQTELQSRGPGNNSRNSLHSGGSLGSGISKSFERDFPSLRAEERQRIPDRVSSPGLIPAAPSLPIGSSAVIGGDHWTSPLADVPAIVAGNGSVFSSSLHTSSISTGLNMAEPWGPPSVRTPLQLPVDTHRIEELVRKQTRQLIPVMPSVVKPAVLNSSDKPKSKGARGDVTGPPKAGQQSPSQLVNHALHAPSRSDVPKTGQSGNFQVLNRERNGVSPTAKDAPSVSRAVNPLSAVASAAIPPLKSPISPNHKADNKGTALSSTHNCFGEKRPLCQAQNRNEFFNTLRKKASMNPSSPTGDPRLAASSSSSQKLGEQHSGTYVSVDQGSSGLDCSIVNGDGVTGGCNACERPERLLSDGGENTSCLEPVVDSDEEEVAFLRSLGWEENGGEEALTPEEIDAFVKEYEKLRPTLQLSHRELRPLMLDLPEQRVSSAAGSGSSR